MAVEPDPALARHLVGRFHSERLSIINASFEDANLADASADLLVAATAFHWVAQGRGMAAIRRIMRPGGWVMLWWRLFFDRSKPDPFAEATSGLVPKLPAEFAEPGRPEFQLDSEHRSRDLTRLAGMVDVSSEIDPWDVVLNVEEVVALYASMAVIRRQPISQQHRILREIEKIAVQDFGGAVTRHFVTALYMGRKP
jgi:SAM-dependent methyltransferase